MNSLTDQQLLRDYTLARSELAFAEFVRRHVDFVYSAALRMVCDAHLAEDVTQGVFVAVAQNARQLRDHPVLSGWLHRTTQNLAANTVRSEIRHRAREQEAAAMNELCATESEALWQHIAPQLDAALGELSEADRDAILLRYFQRKSAREMAHTLGVSEDAAQKRVTRAVERLREFFAKRGVTVGASGLVVALSANVVQAAPVGLAVTISTTAGALVGTTIAATATATAIKAIAMTTLQKTLITATFAVIAGAGIYEARQASHLREQVQTLQQAQAPLTGQVQLLLKERHDATNQLVALREDNERLNRNTDEAVKLRGELSRLRRSPGTPVRTADPPPSTTEAPASKGASPEDIGRALGMAVVRGEPAAMQKVLDLAKAEQQSFKTNSAGLSENLRGNLANRTFAPLRAAFEVIADSAKSNQLALDAVAQATQIPELNGVAIQSLGTLAGSGNNDALEMLLNHEKYGFLLSSTVGALRPAAENGNQKAIEALAAVAGDADKQPLWYMAASGLSKAAESGNPLAIDTLIALSGCTNRNAQRAAVSGLKQAAANQNTKAAEALRSMGVQ